MNSVEVLKALERERQLLENFICLSEEQLLLLQDENIEAVNSLLQRRADLMIEMTAIEATLGTWILQIRNDPSVTPAMMRELRAVNDEIVSMVSSLAVDRIPSPAFRRTHDAIHWEFCHGLAAAHRGLPHPGTFISNFSLRERFIQ